MTDEQTIIINFLNSSPGNWFGKKEIARRAVKRRVYEVDPRWADGPLDDLAAKKVIEGNKDGQFRVNKTDSNPKANTISGGARTLD